MGKKQILTILVVVLLAGVMLLTQANRWRTFQWGIFWSQIGPAQILSAICAVLLIYAAFVLRAWRWKIFMQPVHPTEVSRLLGPTFIGFTGMCLLGRPGEFIRLYLICRKERVSLSSQAAIWMVERIFDAGAFAVLIVAAFTLSSDLKTLPYVGELHRAGYWLGLGAIGLLLAGVLFERYGVIAGKFLQVRFSTTTPGVVKQLLRTGSVVREGFHTVSTWDGFLRVASLSLAMWLVIALAYRTVIHAFPGPLHELSIARVFLLMAFGMVGSLVPVPGGGTSQLLIIAVLLNVFHAELEVAIGCGILLWLATTMAPVPVGLVLLHRERLSLRRLSIEAAATRHVDHLS